jgi:hypothetical protein
MHTFDDGQEPVAAACGRMGAMQQSHSGKPSPSTAANPLHAHPGSRELAYCLVAFQAYLPFVVFGSLPIRPQKSLRSDRPADRSARFAPGRPGWVRTTSHAATPTHPAPCAMRGVTSGALARWRRARRMVMRSFLENAGRTEFLPLVSHKASSNVCMNPLMWLR